VDAAQLNQSIPDELAGCITEWLIAGKFNTLNVAGLREENALASMQWCYFA
jgi:hypothetical protein